MWKYLDLVAATLNANNLGVEVVIKPDTQWSPKGVMELIWRPVQKAVLGKASTTKLDRTEMSEIYDVINKALAERFNIHIPFPSEERKLND